MFAFILSLIVLGLLGLLVRELVSMAKDQAFRDLEDWREGL